MLKKKRILASAILVTTLLLSNKSILFAESEINKNVNENKEKKNKEEEKKELRQGTLNVITVKYDGERISSLLKFRLTNKNTNESREYYTTLGRLDDLKVQEGETYILDLITNENFKMNSIEFKVKYELYSFVAVVENDKTLREIEVFKNIIDHSKGWRLENNEWKYYENGLVKKGWIFVESEKVWYFSNERGVRVTGWHYDNTYNNYYFFDKDGKMKTGWIEDNGQKYYLNKYGAYQKSVWIFENNKWYHLGSNGTVDKGWKYIGNSWYYLNEKGIMQTNWIYLDKNWYYLNSSGAMQTGWLKSNGSWYYLNHHGQMTTNWVHDGSKWYYLNSDGSWNKSGISFADWYVLNGKFRNNSGSRTANVGKDYIVVSLSYQKLWLVRNNDLVLETGVVSGKPSTPTIVGNFNVQYKEQKRYLVGDDYKVWVEYWMPFSGGYGIHDANWHPGYYRFEDYNSYKYYGSHGCVNIYSGHMPTIFNNSYKGMPVIVIP